VFACCIYAIYTIIKNSFMADEPVLAAPADFVQFNKSAVDVDGGKDAYAIDDEGSDFINTDGEEGGIRIVDGVWQTQANDPYKYLSPTAAVKNPAILESANDPDRYYDPESDAFIVLNPMLQAAGIAKLDLVEVTYTNGRQPTTIQAVVGDVGPNYAQGYEQGTLEMSPEAFRQLGIPVTFEVPPYPWYKNTASDPDGVPYKKPKYLGVPDDIDLKVRKVEG